MHVTAPYDWNTCQYNCESKVNELGQNGCCEARSTAGYCVFYPEGQKVSGFNDAKAVSCSGNLMFLDTHASVFSLLNLMFYEMYNIIIFIYLIQLLSE